MRYCLTIEDVEPSGNELPDKVTLLSRVESHDLAFLETIFNLLSVGSKYRLRLSEMRTTSYQLKFKRSMYDTEWVN